MQSLNLFGIFVLLQISLSLCQIPTICYSPTTTCFAPNTTQSLLFVKDSYTTCSRVPPILQLNCVENSMLCNKYANQITNIMCSNKGTDYKGEVIWQCEAKMPTAVKFMKTTVSCEGCTSSIDKLKISGSCAIFYQLGSNSNVLPTSPTTPTTTTNTTKSDDDIRTTLFIICIVLMFFGIYICYCANDNSSRNGYRPINYPEAQPYQATTIEIETTPLNTQRTNNQRSNNYRRYNVQPSAPPAPVQTVPVQTVPVQTMPMQNPIIINAQQQSSTGNLLGGYLTGQNLERGNYGAALLTSTMSSGGSDYNTGLMMGMMSESNSHKHKHKKHHSHNNSSYYQNTYDNSHTDTSYTNTSYADTSYNDTSYTDTSYADTTTR